MGNTLNTAKHDKQAQNCQCNTHPYRIPAKGLLHGATNGIGLYGVVGKTKLTGYQYGKGDSHPALVQSFLYIVGRTANERVFMFLLEQLC